MKKQYGSIDILVNNPGTSRNCGLLDIDEEAWYDMQCVNAKGAFFCLQRAALQMIE